MTNVSPQDGAGSTGDPCSPPTAPPHVPPSLASYEAQALCPVLRCKKEEAPPDVWQGHLEGKALGALTDGCAVKGVVQGLRLIP